MGIRRVSPSNGARIGRLTSRKFLPRISIPRTPCCWNGGSCGVALDDVTPAGILRHLKAFHSGGQPWNGKARDMCRWGDMCENGEMNLDSFGKHVACVHLRSTARPCSTCGREFARPDTLARHISGGCPGA
ncbi:uncharacterized protein LAESUDRAFT_644420 [Laetiporus sulphureus 93-53]|uniref:C2H2-type domain-containing protein n=1 Tax=Laetiporus sulphureus 93-53 TaxID=1314785 RepID=A0A165GJZ2_9APHY|nr:uncharacterized protein LAESUDRAFT_644420 [Laetiporus sulphureus 93-53]KZT10456.1 hypothetical protein LAESUDRAFT_644420 [Laetiporus sulphureus 93-53]